MEKMEFGHFAKVVTKKIREYLPESFSQAKITLQEITKTNGLKLTGLLIRDTDSIVCPIIYLDEYYKEYISGTDMGKILGLIADFRVLHRKQNGFDAGRIMDFSKVQPRIVPYLIRRDWNRSLLEQCPYEEVADLAVTYHVLLAIPQWQHSSVLITNTMMQQWGTDAQTLHELALHNLPYRLSGRLQKMNDILKSYDVTTK